MRRFESGLKSVPSVSKSSGGVGSSSVILSEWRPKETWRRTTEKERTALGFGSWNEPTVAAHDRVTWRRIVSGPIPT